jgi:hypothetical protein
MGWVVTINAGNQGEADPFVLIHLAKAFPPSAEDLCSSF